MTQVYQHRLRRQASLTSQRRGNLVERTHIAEGIAEHVVVDQLTIRGPQVARQLRRPRDVARHTAGTGDPIRQLPVDSLVEFLQPGANLREAKVGVGRIEDVVGVNYNIGVVDA